jgi:hypothetical protein
VIPTKAAVSQSSQDVRRLRLDLEPRRDTQAAREVDEQLAAVGSACQWSGTTQVLAGAARDLPGDTLLSGLSH